MSYFNKLSFASGYYHIRIDGIIELKENMPQEMRKRFWKVWKEFRKEIIESAKAGHFPSTYPCIPLEEEDPNLKQYKDLDLD